MTESGVRVEDDGALWVMRGEIDAAVQTRYEDELLRHAETATRPVRVDLSAVTFMDSGGLRLLYHAATAGPGSPRLVDVPERVRDLLELSGVVGLFELEPEG
ncbi:STAS domain-containing protein [Cellulosimicrobium terreum]|nr:STAS domain-containing protein [Cellulosimicrobium terreum]